MTQAGVTYPSDAITVAAGAAASAAGQARSIDLGGPVEGLSSALPGSVSARSAVELAESWRRGMTGWAEDMARHGEALAASADAMRATDRAGAGEVERVRRTTITDVLG